MKDDQKAWNNRIVGHGEKPADSFNFNPHNWRKHPQSQRDALDAIFSKIGWVTGVVVNKTTGNLIDGHARVEQALKHNSKSPVPFVEVELTEDEERQMLLLLDPIGGLAITDAGMFKDLAAIVDLDSAALMEIVAEISRRDSVETAMLPRIHDEVAAAQLKYLTFDGEKIPLTEAEFDVLRTHLNSHIEKTGVLYGFVAELFDIQ